MHQTADRPKTRFRAPDQTKAVLWEVYHKHFVTNEDLYRLLVPHHKDGNERDSAERSIRAITDRLYKRGMLERQQVKMNDWQFPFVYYMAPEGYRICLDRMNLGDGRDSFNHEKTTDGLYHDHKLTEFHIDLEQAGADIAFWEQRGSVIYQPLKKGDRHDRRTAREPNADVFFGVRRPDGSVTFSYYEEERTRQGGYENKNDGEVGESDQARKVERYVEYRESGEYSAKWQELGTTVEDFYSRWCFKTEARMMNFLRRVSKNYPTRFFQATFEAARRADPLGEIWATPKDFQEGVKYSLLD